MTIQFLSQKKLTGLPFTMRLRIQSYSPLPNVKAWFVPDVQNVPESILDLKKSLCRRVGAFKEGGVQAGDVALFVEEFELLDDCPFGAVRDGDLVCVKMVSDVVGLAMDLDEGVFLFQRGRLLLIGSKSKSGNDRSQCRFFLVGLSGNRLSFCRR
jgi:hypothetical protein